MKTPTNLTPPIVLRDHLRVLMHEDAITAVIRGLKRINPEFFIFGSFEVPKPLSPIVIPLPFSGTLVVNFKIDLENMTVDCAGSVAKSGDGFPNPFHPLPDGQLALYVRVSVSVAGQPPDTTWRENFAIFTWVKCDVEIQTILEEKFVVLTLKDVRVKIADQNNLTLDRILNNILRSILDQNIDKFRFKIKGVFDNQYIQTTVTSTEVHGDALDAHAALT